MADSGDPINRARICIDFGTALSKASMCLDANLPLEVGVRTIPIGAVAGAAHHLLAPSVLFVDGGRLFFGPAALEHAQAGISEGRDPILSFKTVLGAADVPAALAQRMPPSIDPTGTLRARDALTLYLAYLDQLIREALRYAADVPPGIAEAPRRYTSPVWKPGGGVDLAFEQIFNEAAAISKKLGRLLLSPEGISIAQCKDALDKAAAAPGNGHLETGIFEPHAAAAASLAFTSSPTRFVMVFDMGAGTTDIAAFDFDETSDPPSLTEVKPARQCSALAGDEIDRIIVELILRKRHAKDDDSRAMRSLKLAAREMKKELFATGKCQLKNGWISTTINAKDLADDEQFRGYQGALARLIAASLGAVIQRAMQVGGGTIDVVLAGGGSHLPFLPNLVRLVAGNLPANITLRVGPLSPASSYYNTIDPALSSTFPQIAMSVGGALVERMAPA